VACYSTTLCKFFIWNSILKTYSLAKDRPFIAFSTNSHVDSIHNMKMSADGTFVCLARYAIGNDMFIFRKNKNNNDWTDLRIGVGNS